MTRLFAAAMFLAVATAPAFACEWNQSAAADSKQSTVAAQPSDDQATPPPATPASQKQS
jgi:hypothetical protein